MVENESGRRCSIFRKKRMNVKSAVRRRCDMKKKSIKNGNHHGGETKNGKASSDQPACSVRNTESVPSINGEKGVIRDGRKLSLFLQKPRTTQLL